MNKTVFQKAMLLTFLTVFVTGCGGGGTSLNSNDTTYTEGKVTFTDGSSLGVTRAEAQQNGGFNIYDIGTGELVGFISMDGSVNDVNGVDLGVCQNLDISDNGLNGECTLTINNPLNESKEENTQSSSNEGGSGSNEPVTISANITFEEPIYDHDNVPIRPNTQTNSSGQITYKWTLISKPSGSTSDFTEYQSTRSIPNLYVDIVGTYTVKVVVTVEGVSVTDTASFTAIPL